MMKKNLALTLSALALTAVVTVGGTLAYLSDVTNTADNVFASSKKITGHLTEDNWDSTQGGSYTPGQVLAKTPLIWLEKNSSNSYVAVLVSCKDNDGNIIPVADFESKYGDLKDGSSTDINPAWTHIGYQDKLGDVYVLGSSATNLTTLLADPAKDVAAPELFTSVTINTGIKSVWSVNRHTTQLYTIDANGVKTLVDEKADVAENTAYYDNDGNKVNPTKLPGFKIDVKGFLTQVDGVDSATGLANLKGMIGYTN